MAHRLGAPAGQLCDLRIGEPIANNYLYNLSLGWAEFPLYELPR